MSVNSGEFMVSGGAAQPVYIVNQSIPIEETEAIVIGAVTLKDSASAAQAGVGPRVQTPTGNVLQVQIGPGDIISSIPVVMDFDNHQIHEGESHHTFDDQPSLGTGTVKYAVTVPVFANTIQAPHMIIEADIYNGAAKVIMYEGATFTGGSDLTVKNKNRNSAVAPKATLKTGVASANGTIIDVFYAGGGNRIAGNNRANSEWVLKSNTIYRFDVIGQTAGTAAVISFEWYEDLGA
jgi:hypothetical protein